MSTPVIGLTTYREQAAWGVWSVTADVLHAEYADHVVRAGAAPVLLPPATADPAAAAAVVSRLDGLVVSGGADVDPSRYGQRPHERTAGWRPDRDSWEAALLHAAYDASLPVLGVCRGMQLMAVEGGGELDQHTPDRVGHEEHSPGGDVFGLVDVTTRPGSWVAHIEGPSLQVHCHHHQSVRTHPGFTATAWAADGTVEAIEAEGDADAFRMAVQWHPEVHRDQRLFTALVGAARSRGTMSSHEA